MDMHKLTKLLSVADSTDKHNIKQALKSIIDSMQKIKNNLDESVKQSTHSGDYSKVSEYSELNSTASDLIKDIAAQIKDIEDQANEIEVSATDVNKNKTDILELRAAGAYARGYKIIGSNKFVVLVGSTARLQHVKSFNDFKGAIKLKKKLISNGSLVEENGLLKFTKNIEFNSPSLAAGIIAGRASNGQKEWIKTQE